MASGGFADRGTLDLARGRRRGALDRPLGPPAHGKEEQRHHADTSGARRGPVPGRRRGRGAASDHECPPTGPRPWPGRHDVQGVPHRARPG
ncbi:hypothetical protein AB5I41_06150 [Sphingomonas sp. MMS24-JH45]